jgi:3-hydroxybutyryl-CoA dehydratase
VANAAGGLYLEELSVGASAQSGRTITEADILAFAAASGDTNPVHFDAEYAATTRFKERIAHGMLTAGHISAIIGTRLPGPGAVYVGQTLSFRRPVRIGDTVKTVVTISAIDTAKGFVTLECVCSVGGKTVLDGQATVLVATTPTLEA